MKRLFLLAALVSLVPLAQADDQTQAVQQALKDQGFYYGNVDGQGGPETDAAVRRYQIRQGLDVTGKLDEPTLDSLNIKGGASSKSTLEAVPSGGGDAQDAPDTQQRPAAKSVVQDDKDFLQKHSATPAPPAANDDSDQGAQSATPVEPAQPVEPPHADAGQSLPEDYSQFFRKTPYETAPGVVQRSTVQRAEERLAHEGFYRGMADGELSDYLGRALVNYQRYAELRPTGRLDMDTLTDMNLLPRRRAMINPPPPPYGYDSGPREVYRGIWVH